ncbi:NADP-dependent isocitrate dehydrogenase [Allorhodopirellula heiligendammensis]|uniref:Isocitrate dehydrogenase [NADP] n=1 Tax=Allorhodopirellula heiligendammensis TaxID=2714739 RepID=A0A5C6BX69_9BACT|nr:NADP-dependent isocitrate dehydrogenase [Allorhodopirellula heiligendammensis]TWU16555.1 Isocitrate dehydrogenase [NADP] 2 [Allorhodopirellula heiligendammensis]
MAKIVYTITDEAPALATHSLLPILRAFTAASGLEFEASDISLAARVLASFPERLTEEQRVPDALAQLGKLVKEPTANIIKLPNISASIPQLTATIKELQAKGYDIPDFPSDPQTDEEKAIRAAYAKVLGSAVNPVLREGNSDRRVAAPVKKYAQKNPHSMGDWSAQSKTRVAHMREGDFYGSEKSVVLPSADTLRIEHVGESGDVTVLKEEIAVEKDEVFDAAVLSRKQLRAYIAESAAAAKSEGVLLSLHLKATMMKVSDPILFGHAVSVLYGELFEKYGDLLRRAGADPNQGLGQVLGVIGALPADDRAPIEAMMARIESELPSLAMVNSDRGITNLHVPSDVIIDASMPAAIRAGGKMWDQNGELQDTVAMIPDRSYASVYQAVIDDCKTNGTFDVSTMGSVANVGLMAKKAEEYGSHDKTFEIAEPGEVRVVNASGKTLLSHRVAQGDLWRACQTKDVAIVDWVRLAVARARATGAATVFWLDAHRAHDRNLITKVETYLKQHDTKGLDIQILAPVEATLHACARCRQGLDSISVTGNVLRDYLTDLFPILELGTSAKMLSIVPLLAGGGMFETGAGGSAPKHVQQFEAENHLRWDSLGEFLAIAVSLEDLAQKSGDCEFAVLAQTLDTATDRFLEEDKSPSRKVHELDNRGSHFYLALYWAEALAAQDENAVLKERFTPIARQMAENESKIVSELNEAQGVAIDVGGYYFPDSAAATQAMRPSATLNSIIDGLAS